MKTIFLIFLLPLMIFGQDVRSYDSDISFRETMTDELTTRRNGGTPSGSPQWTDGNGVFVSGDSDYITYGSYYGIKSIRFKITLTTTTESIFDFGSSITVTVSSGTITTANISSPTIYVNGTATSTITTAESEVIITTATAFNSSSFKVGDGLDGSLNYVELYNNTLTANEASNLYNGVYYQPLTKTELLYVDSRLGVLTDNVGNTLSNTDVTVVRKGIWSGLSFNGSSSFIAVTETLTPRTLSFWFNPKSTTESIIQLSSSHSITVSSGTVGLIGDASEVIYVNGVAGTTVSAFEWGYITIVGSAGITADDIEIGLVDVTFYDGQMGEVKFLGTTITALEASQDYTSTKWEYK